MWVATEDLPRTAAHPFYTRLNHILETHEAVFTLETGAIVGVTHPLEMPVGLARQVFDRTGQLSDH